MPNIAIALIRHGDYHQRANTPSAHQPFPLTEQGIAQAVKGAEDLKNWATQNDYHIDTTLDSSSLLRAWQTSEHICNVLGPVYSPASYDCLSERSVGSFANMSIEEIESALSLDSRVMSFPSNWKSNRNYRLPVPGAESLMVAGERVAAHINKTLRQLEREHPGKLLKLFVGHGAAFRHAAVNMGILALEDVATVSMHHAAPIVFEYSPRAENPWHCLYGQWKQRSLSDKID